MANETEIKVPDIGDFKDVDIIEVAVKPGDRVKREETLITLESDKATMDIPSPAAGVVKKVLVKAGDKVKEGVTILTLEESAVQTETPALEKAATTAARMETVPAVATTALEPAPPPVSPRPAPATVTGAQIVGASHTAKAHASPSVRHFARELGVDLGLVYGKGPKDRILKEDVMAFIKSMMSGTKLSGRGAFSLPEVAPVDFSKFGAIETRPLARLKRLGGQHLHRSWITVPHVTQFDEADITDLEDFRKSKLEAAKKKNVKLTLIAFLVKAVVDVLQQYPEFNASLSPDGENIILKKYFHIGIAVNTDNGLVVPVIRDADQKGLFDIAAELGRLSDKAREGKLTPTEMQGGCFTISSLGSIGGTSFTPIINAPEVAILGVSRAAIKPVYRDGELVPRLILPYALSYDHRVIDGVAGAQFTQYLSGVLGDIRQILL
ncbi:MAG: dihydrolipoyllysine-residue acetyltransferase [Gammaproteobacteria bacterium]